ncbi:MAG: hypothetical protein QOH31_3081 [Verrucomicrobiota bacterium]|jgi:hypothetical protein
MNNAVFDENADSAGNCKCRALSAEPYAFVSTNRHPLFLSPLTDYRIPSSRFDLTDFSCAER